MRGWVGCGGGGAAESAGAPTAPTHEVPQAAHVVVGEREDDAELDERIQQRVLLQLPQVVRVRPARGDVGDGERAQPARHDQARACARANGGGGEE